ncbi:hypothetical protein DLAC_04987 [Tieghemostelium lacteum]|uniref:Armadillo-like helical domain-containing protein n=1 Tax=Tieghemostelium lacteum TaxID=361077 RepID=A0A151ZI83_TIELA|nr:hypothetical protein DLAC_04987 [Tieghemostelium lacteum]|eukprot:KYQ93609.1 hypothetical protein DLAC_04987 [Tieghemostelium lacteum]
MEQQFLNNLKSRDYNSIKDGLQRLITISEQNEKSTDSANSILMNNLKRQGVFDRLLSLMYSNNNNKDLTITNRILIILNSLTIKEPWQQLGEYIDNNDFYAYMISLLNHYDQSCSQNSMNILLNLINHDAELNTFLIQMGFFYEVNRFMTTKKSFKLPLKRYINLIFKGTSVPMKEIVDYIINWRDSEVILHCLQTISQRKDIKDASLLSFYKFNELFKNHLDILEKRVQAKEQSENKVDNTRELEYIYRIYDNFKTQEDSFNMELLNLTMRLCKLVILNFSLVGVGTKIYMFKTIGTFINHFENEIITENQLLDTFLQVINFTLNNDKETTMVKLDCVTCFNIYLVNFGSSDYNILYKLFDNNILKAYQSLNKDTTLTNLKPFLEAGIQEFDEIYYLSKMNLTEEEFKSLKYSP